jgi:hypothetical protein
MADYGNDLLFGSFITPANTAPQEVVALAQASERAGLDLATFQDHPYHAGFLDTWTLLSYAAARTERIHLAPNVADLPLRPPAVLARAAAPTHRLARLGPARASHSLRRHRRTGLRQAGRLQSPFSRSRLTGCPLSRW